MNNLTISIEELQKRLRQNEEEKQTILNALNMINGNGITHNDNGRMINGNGITHNDNGNGIRQDELVK